MDMMKIAKWALNTTDDEIKRVFTSAWKDFIKLQYDIAKDIYDSCIADYYAQYNPTAYKRHGGQDGSNLYKAEDFNTDFMFNLDILFDASKLEKYKYPKNKDVRQKVLTQVMNGKRGTGLRKRQSEWPMDWRTSYPNKYSKLHSWSSSATTLQTIFDEFDDKCASDTLDKLWESFEKYI